MNKLAQLQLAKELLAQEYLQKQAALDQLLKLAIALPIAGDIPIELAKRLAAKGGPLTKRVALKTRRPRINKARAVPAKRVAQPTAGPVNPKLTPYEQDVAFLRDKEGKGIVNDRLYNRLLYGEAGNNARREAALRKLVANNPAVYNTTGMDIGDPMIANMYRRTANRALATRLALAGLSGAGLGGAGYLYTQ